MLLVFAAALGLIAWRRRLVALVGISLLGVAGMVAAVVRGGPVDGIPSLVAGVVGVLAMSILTRPAPVDRRRAHRVREPRAPAAPCCSAAAGVAALAAVGGAGGLALDRVRQAGSPPAG